MSEMLSYCGLDCGACPAYLATQAGDTARQKALLEEWRVKFDAPHLTLATFACDGCPNDGRLSGLCTHCQIRACARGRGLSTCAACADFEDCQTLQGFIAEIPEAQANLAALR